MRQFLETQELDSNRDDFGAIQFCDFLIKLIAVAVVSRMSIHFHIKSNLDFNFIQIKKIKSFIT